MAGEQQALLTALADPRGGFGWHRDYAEVLPGAWLDYLALETAATEIAAYDAQRIPGLLHAGASGGGGDRISASFHRGDIKRGIGGLTASSVRLPSPLNARPARRGG